MSFTTGAGTPVTDAYDIDAEIEDDVARDLLSQAMDVFISYYTVCT